VILLLFGPIIAVPLTLIVVLQGCISTGYALHGSFQPKPVEIAHRGSANPSRLTLQGA
jgi:hypothetical protein